MEKYTYIGKIVNTHGLKGEMKIISDFSRKKSVFIVNNKLYIGKNKEEFTILKYRPHKQFDMVVLNGINRIEEVERIKGLSAFVMTEDIDHKDIVVEELVDYKIIYNNEKIGKVTSLNTNGKYYLLTIATTGGYVLIPYLDEFIKNIDRDSEEITVINCDGLL